MSETLDQRLNRVEREIRESQAKQQQDADAALPIARPLPYSRIQGVTGAWVEGKWVDRSTMTTEEWSVVPKPKAYRETVHECIHPLPTPELPAEVWQALSEAAKVL